jgi:hypothetical protein
VIDLKGKDPDDAFSSVPYEKGFVFLYYLEKLIGKAKWDKFIPHVSFLCLLFIIADQILMTSIVLHGIQIQIPRLL